jgi:hypothetical protein
MERTISFMELRISDPALTETEWAIAEAFALKAQKDFEKNG